ncbi:hypothetical protein LTR78_006363 [Recurvomyces mirabilis]|uniref:Uncharacterized protein n=1 Tax=Recurvomyces mirabilis TaxID=574656 RepID=A0AAE1C0A2_9PEZI|nr:hypothetical protein LTR78_006363 [Recurvomyces mirabilis]KAK5152250.1 hypothetical protein LTS14_008627 [Recurvomyces mirabilis]
MRIPSLPGSGLDLTRQQHESLDQLFDNGKGAVRLVTRTLVQRASQSSDASGSSSTCGPGNTSSICAKPTDSGSTQTLPIVLGAVIPITCALVVCFFLHRRLVKRQRIEDTNDAHKSLDFGMDMGANRNKLSKSVPEMTVTDAGGRPVRPGRGPRGLSMDMNMSNPYLLPAGLQGSHESIHSMSRSMVGEHDPYRPVTMMRTSIDSSRPRPDGASQYSASTLLSANEKAGLVSNAQRISHSDPKRIDSMSPHNSKQLDEMAPRQMHSNGRSLPASRRTSIGSDQPMLPANNGAPPPRKQSLPRPPPPPQSADENVEPRSRSTSAPRPPRKSSMSAGSVKNAGMPYEEAPPLPVPAVHVQEDSVYDIDPSMISTGRFSIDTPNPSQQFPVQPQRLSTMGLRPLPPDMPTEDNPEIRANRIRSFYKEYFDDSRPNPSRGQYVEDYDPGYFDATIYDPDTGGFAMPRQPYAQPMGRRAMTPPPRGAQSRGASPAGLPHNRHYSTQSAGRGQMRGRQGGAPPMPKKRAPPPIALQGLPTPHKLKDFDSVISTPIDFAPPSTFRSMQNGSAPDSPTGLSRPYSPSVRAFTPLVASYDELSVMPSPHMLRRSGTFTALDFAPPGRLGQHNDNASDAGSIRSARSGISARQMDAVRAGAYRVSRIPKEMVTTKEDLAAQLRPKLDMVSKA